MILVLGIGGLLRLPYTVYQLYVRPGDVLIKKLSWNYNHYSDDVQMMERGGLLWSPGQREY